MNTKTLITLFSLILIFCAYPASAKKNKHIQFVLGPVEISSVQTLKVCSTDLSVVERSMVTASNEVLSPLAYGDEEKLNRVVSSRTRVEVFDSTDTTRPLPVKVDDIVYGSGKGGCASIPGYEIDSNGLSRSVVVVLTTITSARSTFNPIVTGQIRAPRGESGISLLLPAIQR